jgi:hypothetical protein
VKCSALERLISERILIGDGGRNLRVITGDPPRLGEYPTFAVVFHMDLIAPTAVVDNLNRGVDSLGNGVAPPPSPLIRVGANPVAAGLG